MEFEAPVRETQPEGPVAELFQLGDSFSGVVVILPESIGPDANPPDIQHHLTSLSLS